MSPMRVSPRAPAPGPSTPQATPARAGAERSGPTDGFDRSASPQPAPLRRGAVGALVRQLQQRLVAAGFLSPRDLQTGPGVYGPRTEAAVQRLQASVGLEPTGVAGPPTFAALASGARFQGPTPRREASEAKTDPFRAAVVPAPSQTLTEEITLPLGRPAVKR